MATMFTSLGPWKRWFAWRPVRIDDELVWLRHIERRRVICTIPTNGFVHRMHEYQIAPSPR